MNQFFQHFSWATAGCGGGDAFPLTLTLSLGEREQQSVFNFFRKTVRQIQSQVFSGDGERFSLSLEVRGKMSNETPGLTISKQRQ